MKKYKNIVGIIPARSGSKGLINKNILELCGHPLLSYSIKASLNSKLISKTIVSTDCKKIADIALEYGAEVPFLRPLELSHDESLDRDFLDHCLKEFNRTDFDVDLFVLLRPTSPLRLVGLVDQGIEYFSSVENSTSLRSIVKAPYTPFKMWKKKNNFLEPLIGDYENEFYNYPRQKLEEIWFQAGTIDLIPVSTLLSGSASGNKITYLEINSEDFCDIDSFESLELAESKISAKKYINFTE